MTTMILFLLMVVVVVVDVVLLVVGGVPGVAVAAGLNPLLLSADTTTTAPFTRSTTPILQSLVLCYRTTSSSTTTTRSSIPPNLYHHQADATHVDVQLGTTTSSSSSSLSSRRNRSCVLVDHIIAIQPGGGGDDNGGGTPQQTEATTTTWTTPQHPQQQEPHQRPPPQTTTRRPTIAMTSTRSSTTTDDSTTTTTTNLTTIPWMDPQPPPHPPRQLPLRFLRAGKGNVQEAIRRYQATLAWRRQEGMDAILREANPFFPLIKRYYPHYYHGRGYHGEPCFYEQPAQTNLPALRKAGVTLPRLLRHYAMVTEFQWQYLVQHDDLAKSIYVIDLEGLKLTDFAGPVVAYIKSASALSAQHYPERAGVGTCQKNKLSTFFPVFVENCCCNCWEVR